MYVFSRAAISKTRDEPNNTKINHLRAKPVLETVKPFCAKMLTGREEFKENIFF
jgi:hypothetical protein